MALTGSACGYYTEVGLFGGPPSRRGCGQDATAPARSASPSVALPEGGSGAAITATDDDGVMAEYGPAIIFAGRPPEDPNAPIPPTGAVKVSTKGKKSVTSSASVKSVGPGPFVANAVKSTCTAAATGVTAKTTITKGELVTAFDKNGNPKTIKQIPTEPTKNYSLKGTASNGDKFKAVFNEQIKEPGGITVNAVHIYLLGDIAVGDIVVAQSSAAI